MKAYILCILIATIINFINEKYFLDKKKKTSFILIIASIFVICFVAGVRSIDVGTDVKVYVTRLIGIINSSTTFISFIKNSNSDLLFSLLVYESYMLKDINIVLFAIELFVALPIYIYSYLERKKYSFTINILIFLLTMYCPSLNIMRQSIAISFCILSYHFFNENKYKKSFIILFTASLFHKTAIVFTAVFLINYFIKKLNKDKTFATLFLIIVISLTSLSINKIVSLTSYSSYLTRLSLMREFSIGSVIKKVFWLLLAFLSMNRGIENKHKDDIYISAVIASISLILTIFSFKIPGIGRLGYYFNDILYFLLINEVPKSFKEKKTVKLILVVLLIFLWWNMTKVENDTSKVYPYYSDKVEYLNEAR